MLQSPTPASISAALAFGLAANACAADKQVEALLARMRAAYAGVKTATYTTETHYPNANWITTFSFSKPARVRLKVSEPGKAKSADSMIIITDGKAVSLQPPGTSLIENEPFTLEGFEKHLPANLESYCFFDFDRQLSTSPGKNMANSTFKIVPNQTWLGKNWTVLEETAKVQKVFCRYFIDPKTSLIWRTIVKPLPGGPEGADLDSKITALNTAAKLDDSIFKVAHMK